MINILKCLCFLFVFFTHILFSDQIKMSDRYSYNENGRIVIPKQEDIVNLPDDGGDLWNRLIFESSPYLLQHSANPVNWYPWGEEAFKLANDLNKPIFLSIGYTTCHWCHVMEHESFEDEEIAKLMNEVFINIKVDREERPDIDNVYMEFTQELTGRGGWPMTVIMTPDKKPFFAGTYFPKKSIPNYNRIGMFDLIPQIKNLWDDKKDSILISADKIVSSIRKKHLDKSNNIILNDDILEKSFRLFDERFDNEFGGFKGSNNKFPKPHDYSFLAKYYYKSKSTRAYEMIEKSLYSMRHGGIYDQIGFGFHRYSTDKKWLVPHFEKMLYDQAMIIHAYLDAYLIKPDDLYKKTVNEICEYILRDMTDENGGFYSAEDADSEGGEGVFYIWDYTEFKKFLTVSEYEFMVDVLSFTENGNSVVKGERVNIPHFTGDWEKLSIKYGLNIDDIKEKYDDIRNKVFLYREKRVHPQKDDKILTDWNGLMISALARSAVLFDNDEYLLAAKKSADFIISELFQEDGKLLKRYRNGIAGIDGMIEDYAFFIWGLIELYQADFDVKYIDLARKLSDYQYKHFWDLENNGFYFTSDLSEELVVKSKEVYDGAIPSGNSVSAYNYLRLSRILSRYDYEEIALKIIETFSYHLNRFPISCSMLLQAISFLEGPSYEVIIVGDLEKSKDLIKYIQKIDNPNKVIIYNNSKNTIFDFLHNYKAGPKNEPLVYVCKDYSCKLPTNDLNQISDMLK